jgi:alpha-tubulin suppressor-like RCC1 family protein
MVFTCVVINGGASGTVKCWGENNNGELGVATGTATAYIEPQATPVSIPYVGGGTGIQKIAAGGQHTCALDDKGNVYCWGYNISGQLGIPADGAQHLPTWVPGITSVTDIAAGFGYTCAIQTTGGIKCWGKNDMGQLSNGANTTNTEIPTTVVSGGGTLASITAIAAGYAHACARKSDGTVWCWGRGMEGALGDGVSHSTIPAVFAAVQVSGIDGTVVAATAISAGGDTSDFSCALVTVGGTTGHIRCWGYNNGGRLGDGTITASLVPVSVKDFK